MKAIAKSFVAECRAAMVSTDGWAFTDSGVVECHDEQGRLVKVWKDDAGLVQESRSADTGALAQLTESHIAALKAVLAAHDSTPIMFQGEQVWDAASVDAVTVKRIMAVAGDINSQIKSLRLAVWAEHVKGNGNAFGQADKDKADAIIAASLALNTQVEAIRAEGVAFKQSKGWA